jgi:hypothetical protein
MNGLREFFFFWSSSLQVGDRGSGIAANFTSRLAYFLERDVCSLTGLKQMPMNERPNWGKTKEGKRVCLLPLAQIGRRGRSEEDYQLTREMIENDSVEGRNGEKTSNDQKINGSRQKY